MSAGPGAVAPTWSAVATSPVVQAPANDGSGASLDLVRELGQRGAARRSTHHDSRIGSPPAAKHTGRELAIGGWTLMAATTAPVGVVTRVSP